MFNKNNIYNKQLQQYEQTCFVDNQDDIDKFNNNQYDFYEFYNNETKVFTIPCGVRVLSKSNCQKLKSDELEISKLVIPDSVQTISYGTFREFDNIYSIDIPDSVTEVGDQAFYVCANIRNVTIGNGISVVHSNSFARLRKADKIIFNNNKITQIEKQAFEYCNNLKQIVLPSSVQSLGRELFTSNYNLKSIQLPDKVRIIGNATFKQASDLKCLSIVNLEFQHEGDILENSPFQGTELTDLNDTCPNAPYIQCPEDNSQYYQYYINGTKVCIEEEYVLYFVTNSSDAQNDKYFVNECPDNMLYFVKTVLPYQCVTQCPNEQPYSKMNDLDMFECYDNCQGEYANLQSEDGNRCDLQCTYYEMNSIKYCTEQCPETQPLEVQSDRKQCTDSCENARIKDYKYSQNDTLCVKECGSQQYLDEQLVSCVVSCGEKYYYSYSTEDKRCSQSECQDAFQYNQYGSDTPLLYKYGTEDKQCYQQCSGIYALPNQGYICDDSCRFYQNPTKSYRQCTQDNSTCPSTFKYGLGVEDKQCVNQCPYYYNDNYQYIYIPENNQSKYYCLQNCGEYVWYTSNNNNYCTEKQSCKDVEQYTFTQYNTNNKYCVYSCEQYVWFEQEENKYCSNHYNCTYNEQQYILYDKQTFDNQCVKVCQFYYYIDDNGLKKCTQYKNCDDSSTIRHGYYIQKDNKCSDNCGDNYYYILDRQTYICTQGQSCADAQITSENENGEINIEKTFYYRLNASSDQCIQTCIGQFAQPYNLDGSNNYVCDTECRYYNRLNDSEIFKICTESLDKCTENYPYQSSTQIRQCIEACNQNEYMIEDTQPMKCVEECTAQHLYLQDRICLQDCPEGYAKPILREMQCSLTCDFEVINGEMYCVINDKYISEDRYQCVSQCSEIVDQELNYSQEDMCVEQCTDNYAYPINGEDKCNNTCTYYISEDNQQMYCMNNNECDDEYKYILLENQRKQCVKECVQPKQYIQNQICQEICNQEYAVQQNTNICNNQCKYYIQDSVKYCVQDNKCPEQQYTVQESREYCVQQCFDNWYVQNEICVAQCSNEYAYPVSGNICDNKCNYEMTQNQKYCMINNECNEQQVYIQQNDRKRCTYDCQQIQEQNLKYLQNNQCVEQCVEPFQYIQDNQCLEECQQGYSLHNDSNICDDQCNFRIIESIMHCVEDNTCKEDDLITIINDNRYQCSKQCSEVILQTKQFQQENTCVETCTGEYALPSGQSNVCNNVCAYFELPKSEQKQCVENNNCPEGYYLQQNDRNQCIIQCMKDQFVQDNVCVNSCSQEYAYQVANIICNNTCNFQVINNKQDKQCIYDNICDEQQVKVLYSQDRYQCEYSCNKMLNENLQYQQEQTCVEQCINDWAVSMQETSCDNTCNFQLYKNSEIRYCVQNNECKENQLKTKVLNDRYQCSSSCNELIIDNLTYIQDNTCVEQCQQEYAIDNNNVCNNTCNYYIEGKTQQMYCVNDQCPSDYQFTIQGERNQCVDSCPEQLKYILNNICLEQCDEDYSIHQDSNICDDQCNFRLNDNKQYCIEDDNCKEDELFVQVNDKIQCVTQCQDSLIDNMVFQQDKQCVQICQNKYWYQTEQSKICLNQCQDQELYALELITNQCDTVTNCYQYYHIESEFDNTQCQYIKEQESCYDYRNSQYENIQVMIYQFEDSNKCTDCSFKGYEKISQNDIQICLQQNKSSNIGAIVGGIIGAIIIIAAIIIVIFIIHNKKLQKQNDQSTIQMNNNEEQMDSSTSSVNNQQQVKQKIVL